MTPDVEVVRVPLREPQAAAHGVLTERELVLVSLSDGEHTGWGEAAPLESYDGVSIAAVLDALDGGPMVPPAAAALDLARRDLDARRAGVPLVAGARRG